MASKQKHTGKGKSSAAFKPKTKGTSQSGHWLKAALYGLAGAFVFYFLHPILSFKGEDSKGVIAGMTFLSAFLAFIGSTRFFRQHLHSLALWTIPLVVLQVLINLLLTYGWVTQDTIWMVPANLLTIPTGIIWFFILQAAFDKGGGIPDSHNDFTIKDVFAHPSTKMTGLVIFFIAGVLCFYRLGYYDIWEDENLVINAAIGFQENGFSYFKEGYDRAWIHTVICAVFFDIFGVSEFTGRLPSALFGLAFVLISFFVFARWYGLAWLALLVPVICLMNDRFLILFRYMRMYALLIPVFLAGVYFIYKAITLWQQQQSDQLTSSRTTRQRWIYTAIALLFFPLLAHIHKLSMVLIPVVGLFILYQLGVYRTKTQMRLLYMVLGTGVLLLILTFVVQLDSLLMFRQVSRRIFTSHAPMPAYFEYMLENGLPRNSTLMILLAGLGLIGSGLSQRMKSLLVFNYLLIITALLSMVYLVEGEGRDYRYIAHIVPFVVGTLLVITYYIGQVFGKKTYPWILTGVFALSSLQFIHDYKRVYVKHPWAPSYSVVYQSLKSRYTPGDALFAQNVKSYYLDPVALAGEHYHKISKRSDYSLQQFLSDVQIEGHGWVMWELHKSHHWRKDILQYIYKNFKPIHSQHLDDLGVALFYYDETMIPQD